MLTHEQLFAIRERAELAVDAPFDFDGDYIRDKDGYILAEVLRTPHGEFFAHARTDIPLLIAEVIRLRAALTEIAHYEAPFGLDATGYEVLRIMAQQALNNGGDTE